jgi:uncharacterized protein (TIGR02246 family)
MTDEDQIRELYALWAERDADKDAEGWSQLYTEDGKFISGRRVEYVGRAAIRKNLEDRTAASPPDRHTMHIFGTPFIRVDGDHAESRSAYVAYGRVGNGPWEVMTIGRFHTRLVRANAGWLFTEVDNRAIGTPTGLVAPPPPAQ